MLWQVLRKRSLQVWLPGHPPLTSLRSFAPPYALRRGLVVCLQPRDAPCHSRNTLSFRAKRGIFPLRRA